MKLTTVTSCLAAGLIASLVPAAPLAAQTVLPAAPPAALSGPAAATAAKSDDRAVPKPPVTRDDYRVGPGDKLRIEVYKDLQLSQSVQVRPDGKITLPLIGDMEATGHTPLELRESITVSLKEYMTNPVVTVIVVEAVASQVFVMGEVSKAGPIALSGPTTVLQALAMAGGFREFANTKEVRVLRTTATGTETIKFNYKQAVNGSGTPVYLRSGDTIIVP